MATYNKPTLDVTILTKMGFEAQASGIMAQAALDNYKAKKTVKALYENQHEVLIPYHAITQFEYAYLTEEAEKADAYCGGGTEPVGEVWYTGVVDPSVECVEGLRMVTLSPTTLADSESLLNNPEDYSIAINDTEVHYTQGSAEVGREWYSDSRPYAFAVLREDLQGEIIYGFIPCDSTETTVSITVAHK